MLIAAEKAPVPGEVNRLEITTIDSYFSKKYNGTELQTFYTTLSDKFLSYKFPLEICLSSTFQFNYNLLGTLTFIQLDINGYPTYGGDVAKSSEGSKEVYSTTLNFDGNRWTFILIKSFLDTTFGIDGNVFYPVGVPNITIDSVLTTSLDPTKVDYREISTPTSGSCKKL